MERKQNKTEKSTNVGGTLNGGWGYFYCHLNAYLLKKVVMGGGGAKLVYQSYSLPFFKSSQSGYTSTPPPPFKISRFSHR